MSLFAVCVATVVLAVATAAIGIRALATGGTEAPAWDEAVAAAESDGTGAYVATARFDRKSDGTELVVSKLRSGARPGLDELPPPPMAEQLEGNRGIGLASLPDGPCAQYSVRASSGQTEPLISCFSPATGGWSEGPDLKRRVLPGELVDSFAARGEAMFVALASARGTSVRVLRLRGDAADDLGVVASSRRPGLFVDFNAPASSGEATPTVSVETNLGGNRSARVIRALSSDGAWTGVTRAIRSVYPAQSGGAARGAGRWVVTESRSLPERGISSFGVKATRGASAAWRVLRPANVAATSGYSQGNPHSARGRVRIAWSEQGRLARPGIPIRVYAARVALKSSRVGARQLLWSGRMKSFPPVPRIVTVGAAAYAVFERPAGRGATIRASVSKIR